MSVNESINKNNSSVMLDSFKNNNVYHAVFVNEQPTTPETEDPDKLHVYTDKLDALKVIKKYKTSRLKSFRSREEAESYAKYGDLDNKQVNGDEKISECKSADEKGPAFKSLKPQELVVFRKLIETGDLEGVRKAIWENPRYLISVSATPTILKEGPRYNALHVATSKNTDAFNMCKLILDVISDRNFIELIDGIEESASYVNKSKVFIDAFLNTPNKGINETPLHFAAKYGLKDVVALLVSYPQCSKTVKNKYDKMPIDIVCDRKGAENPQLIQEICTLLEDHYYVPVMRSEDNSMAPAVGDLFTPASPPRIEIDPISPRFEVKAFAGPMTKPQALEFRKKWKTPPRTLFGTPRRDTSLNDSFQFLNDSVVEKTDCRLVDFDKGLERVGRDLAEEYHVPWKEYWPFLNEFVNLKSTEGLDKLENYLSNLQRHERLEAVNSVEDPQKPTFKSKRIKNLAKDFTNDNCIESAPADDTDDIKPIFYNSHDNNLFDNFDNNNLDVKNKVNETYNSDIDALIKNMGLLILNSPDKVIDDKFYTPPSSPLPTDNNSSDYSDYYDDDTDSSSEDEMYVASEGLPVFIEGSAPSKTDLSVFNAIPQSIDPEIYPLIYRWRHDLQLAVRKNDISVSFRTPRKKLFTPSK
ncbi:ankyrin repeat and LEM domain-containing protein 2 [Microplitis demolitor]|uniref:ankyrin repeat and LEM domain-containing protein 2 n=1 Tax=Microplitis demolitor TaxID=69319 RepID=UPI00044002EE|nr:ankyrin repeat and LEM domain-containing protein 2 [Microplitis demolitor]